MRRSFLDDKRFDGGRDDSLPPLPWSGTLGVERVKLSCRSLQRPLPPVQGAAGDAEGIPRRPLPVRAPKVEYLRSPVHGIVIAHMPEAYDSLVHGQPPLRTLQNVELAHGSSIMGSARCI